MVGRSDWVRQYSAHLGTEPAVASPCSLRSSGGRFLDRSQALDSLEVGLLSARGRIECSFPCQVRRGITQRVPRRQTPFSWFPERTEKAEKVCRFCRCAIPAKVGCLCQTSVRQPASGFEVSRPLHASSRH